MSSSEFDAFYKNYVDLQNTGVKALGGATVENGASAEDVTAAVSGTQATMTYNDGSTKTFNVDWNADDLAAVDTSKAGTYEVKGTVQQLSLIHISRSRQWAGVKTRLTALGKLRSTSPPI